MTVKSTVSMDVVICSAITVITTRFTGKYRDSKSTVFMDVLICSDKYEILSR